MEDDLYPNDSFYFPREPLEQSIGRKKERANTLKDIAILQELVDHLERRIAFYDSVSSIPDDVRATPSEFLIMHNAHMMMVVNLKSEKEYIESLLSTHAPNR